MNCLVSMETTPRAPTWTVEDIGTQLHSKKSWKKKGKNCVARVQNTVVLSLCVCPCSESRLETQPRAINSMTLFIPILTDHLQETCTCGGLHTPKRDTVEHMDAFTWTIVSVNGCQDGACGRRQQPQANCDPQRNTHTHTEEDMWVRAGRRKHNL